MITVFVPSEGWGVSLIIIARAILVALALDRRMRGCLVLILRRWASSDFESKYEWPQGIVGDWQGGEVSMKRPRVVIPWFGLVVCWLNNG